MKTPLKISILLNLGLLAGLIFLLATRPTPVAVESPPLVVDNPPPEKGRLAVTSPSPAPSDQPPFRWSQLDSADYHIYVKNLRGIGCPEPTLRAIVSADVHGAFRYRIQALEQQLTTFANSRGLSSDFSSEEGLKAELQSIPTLEATEIADLLGLKSSMGQMTDDASADPTPARDQTQPQVEQTVSLPHVFLDVEAASLSLNEEQMAAVADLRKRFLEEIGGTNQNAYDPAYLARWQKAQPTSDSLLRLALGSDSYMKFIMSAQNPEPSQR